MSTVLRLDKQALEYLLDRDKDLALSLSTAVLNEAVGKYLKSVQQEVFRSPLIKLEKDKLQKEVADEIKRQLGYIPGSYGAVGRIVSTDAKAAIRKEVEIVLKTEVEKEVNDRIKPADIQRQVETVMRSIIWGEVQRQIKEQVELEMEKVTSTIQAKVKDVIAASFKL